MRLLEYKYVCFLSGLNPFESDLIESLVHLNEQMNALDRETVTWPLFICYLPHRDYPEEKVFKYFYNDEIVCCFVLDDCMDTVYITGMGGPCNVEVYLN